MVFPLHPVLKQKFRKLTIEANKKFQSVVGSGYPLLSLTQSVFIPEFYHAELDSASHSALLSSVQYL